MRSESSIFIKNTFIILLIKTIIIFKYLPYFQIINSIFFLLCYPFITQSNQNQLIIIILYLFSILNFYNQLLQNISLIQKQLHTYMNSDVLSQQIHASTHQITNTQTNITRSPLFLQVVNQIFVVHQIAQLQRQTQEYRMMKYYNQRLGLSKKYYSQLKKMKITKTSQSCSICQQPYQKDQLVIQFPCKHIFHKSQCIKGWLKISSKCPICKLDLQEHYRKKQQEINECEKVTKGTLKGERYGEKNAKRQQLKAWLQNESNGNKNKQISQNKLENKNPL